MSVRSCCFCLSVLWELRKFISTLGLLAENTRMQWGHQDVQEAGSARPFCMKRPQPHRLCPHHLLLICFPILFLFFQVEMTNSFQRTLVENNLFMCLAQLARVRAGNAGDLSEAAHRHGRWASCTAQGLFPSFISSSFSLFPFYEGFQIPFQGLQSCCCKITDSHGT